MSQGTKSPGHKLVIADDAVLVALGANLPSRFGPPRETLEAALAAMAELGINVVLRSPWYKTAPVPASSQDWFVNGVAAVQSDFDPVALLAALHRIEAGFGRVRREANEARVLDLDLLAHGRLIRGEAPPLLPHPRLQDRAFVLLPLADIVPDWVHPLTGDGVNVLLSRLPEGQKAERLAD